MIDCKKIKNCANDILRSIKKYKKVKKSDEKILLSMIVKYIDKLIFNYVAMASLLCLKLGIKKIMLKHMLFISKCVDSLCLKSTSKIMRGGAFNTAAFYGIKEDNYKVENEGVDIMNSDLTECIRPALKTTQNGGTLTKCKVLNNMLESKLKEVFKYFGIKISKQTLVVIASKLENNINAILIKIKMIRSSSISPNNMKKLFLVKK